MDEGWTTVKGRHRRPKNTKSAPSSLLSPATRTVPHLEVTEMKDEYNTVLRKFMKSTSYHIIRTIAWEFTLNAEQIPITKAICLGIGTFDPSDGSLAIKQKAHKQLAAFLVMVEELEKHTGGHIECIFQEPMFTPGDISFLNEMGHRVVESPVGSEAVDSQTFLYGVHLYKDIYSMSLQGELPAVFVGTGWDAWSETFHPSPLNDVDLSAIEKMHNTYEIYPFPQESGDYTFYKTQVYVRPPPKSSPAPDVEIEAEDDGYTNAFFAVAPPEDGGCNVRGGV